MSRTHQTSLKSPLSASRRAIHWIGSGMLAFSPLFLTSWTHAQEMSWIWSSAKAVDNEKADFKTTFQIGKPVKQATLKYTCDNGAQAFLNGKAAGKNPDWQEPTTVKVKDLLKNGDNELLIHAKNEEGVAALVVQLEIEFEDGEKKKIVTDQSWKTSKPGKNEWNAVHVVAKYGASPWNDAFANASAGAATPADQIAVQEGFKVELLYSIPKEEEGSWVALTNVPGGRLIGADQGGGLWLFTPGKNAEESQVQRIETQLSGVHGLLWAFDSLYAMVNERGQRGLYRLRGFKNGKFEEEKLLRSFDGGGEHGPHQIVLSPDGKSLYLALGNHTKLVQPLEKSRAARAWGEDHVVTRLWDANGHARGVMAPGGYVLKTDPDGKEMELVSYGYRNQYDVAFNPLGDMFTYDSDMEWDAGMPWYRPTRINLATSGSDMGWRSGAGKWPVYYPDSLPAIANIGPGSPTGVLSGKGSKFPAKYQNAIFANDWTYGTMYVVFLTPKGGGYEAKVEEFISGKPLPLTDSVVLPEDGAMYFAIGGRNTQSGIYRVSYEGKDSTQPAPKPTPTPEMTLRWELEKLHESAPDASVVAKAWPHLNHPDRWVRWAARVAIERQPVASWGQKALEESSAWGSLEAAVALARIADSKAQAGLLKKLNALDFGSLDEAQKLALIRAYQLTIVRQGKPEGEIRQAALERLDALYPAATNELNVELAQTLSALESTQVVPKTVQLMATARDEEVDFGVSSELLGRNSGYANAFNKATDSMPNRQQIALAYAIRETKSGWTPELRKTFFSWFPRTTAWTGGNSFRGFIETIRKDALANAVTDEAERKALDELSSKKEAAANLANFVMPKGPGKNYTTDEVVQLIPNKESLKGRNFENGKNMFVSTMCLTCHRFNGEGGSVGPDITGSVNRYTIRDLVENIIEPSKVVSDQYETHQIKKKDGSVVIGRIMVEENGKVFVAINPFAPQDTLGIAEDEIESKQPYPISMMPPGLINSLNAEELKDLVAYILSAGNPNDPVFK